MFSYEAKRYDFMSKLVDFLVLLEDQTLGNKKL